ncbi:hypothetical protein [Streptomyces sp. NPDC090025]|uniref:hypothetical protein n=1 Tax=Streptomyces sp. NPDC090025 TaxID=3365922 RepID=UPI0038375019
MIDRRCRRSGCRFPRGRTIGRTERLRPCCSPECLAWLRRARTVAAGAEGPAAEAEARELLGIARALDRRRRPDEPVPELPLQPNPRWAYAVTAV